MSAKPKRVGRPKLPKGEVRGLPISTRLKRDEDREVRDAIKRSGIGQSDWLRNALLTAARSDSK